MSKQSGSSLRGTAGVVLVVVLAVVMLLEVVLIMDVPPEPELFTVADVEDREQQQAHASQQNMRLTQQPLQQTQQTQQQQPARQAGPVTAARPMPDRENYPLVALLHGKPKDAPYEWNTGVWPSWGQHEGDLYGRQVTTKLLWQAEGAYIVKGCDAHCYITHDQDMVEEADAVVMELVNHYKFYGTNTQLPLPWPKRLPGSERVTGMEQLWIMFHYEARDTCAHFMDRPDVMEQFQLTMTPEQSSDIPISLVCDWGRRREEFLLAPPPRTVFTRPLEPEQEVHIADFSGSFPGEAYRYRRALEDAFAIDAFSGPFQNSQEEGDYTLAKRMRTIGHYKFTIVSEGIVERDWVCPELSQTLLAGSVPIYFGAENVSDYLPGENSIVEARLFENAQALVDHISMLLSDEREYAKHFEWKSKGLSPQFHTQLDRCTHYAECRVCKEVLRRNGHL